MYSQGSSEKILGRALKDFADRDDIVIATKVRHPMRPGPNGKGLSRKAIMTEIDHSLRRTQIDDAVASLDIDLTDDEAAALEAHYTPATTSRASPTTPNSPASWPASRASRPQAPDRSATTEPSCPVRPNMAKGVPPEHAIGRFPRTSLPASRVGGWLQT